MAVNYNNDGTFLGYFNTLKELTMKYTGYAGCVAIVGNALYYHNGEQWRVLSTANTENAHCLDADSPTRKDFLSRIADDVASGKITFLKGLEAIGAAYFRDGAEFGEFVQGLCNGSGATIDKDGNAEVESMRVRSGLQTCGNVSIGSTDGSDGIHYNSEDGITTIGKAVISPHSTVSGKTLERISEEAEAGTLSVHVYSDRGNFIFQGEGTRVLTALVYRRGENITDTISPTSFSWQRESRNSVDDKIWNKLHSGIGNKCTVTQDDIAHSAVFSCVIDLSD